MLRGWCPQSPRETKASRPGDARSVPLKKDILDFDLIYLFAEDTDLDSSLLEASSGPIETEEGPVPADAETDSVAAHTQSARLAEIHFPPELWMQICPHVEDQGDLARLARVSSGMCSIAERTLYKNVRVTSASALYCLHERFFDSECSDSYAQHVRGFTAYIPTSEWLTDWGVAGALTLCLEVLVNLEHLAIGSLKTDMTDWVFGEPCREWEKAYNEFPLRDEAKLLPRLRTLDAPAALLQHFKIPKATVTHLSLRMRWASEDLIAFQSLSRLFGSSLVSLRIERVFECACHRESPVRVCAKLDTPRLEYMEIADAALYMKYVSTQQPWRGPFAANRVDGLEYDSPEQVTARAKLPRLRELVWSPVVGEHYTRFSRGYGDGFRTFVKWMNEAVADMGALPLDTLAIRVQKDVFNFQREHDTFCDWDGNKSAWSPEMGSRWQDYEGLDATS